MRNTCCSACDGGKRKFPLVPSLFLSLSANLKARQPVRPLCFHNANYFRPPPLGPRPLTSTIPIQSPALAVQGQYVVRPRPCPHSVTRASSFESVSVSLIDSEQLPPPPPTIAPLSTTFRRLRHRRCFSAIPHPHRIRRRRRHHPDGNVTLWHLRKKRRGGETRMDPAAFAARGMNPQRFINSNEPSSSTSLSRLQLFCLAEWRQENQSEWESRGRQGKGSVCFV